MDSEARQPGPGEARQPALNRLLAHAYRDRTRCSRAQVRAAAESLDLPSALLARIEALPDGDYTREELVTALPRGDPARTVQ